MGESSEQNVLLLQAFAAKAPQLCQHLGDQWQPFSVKLRDLLLLLQSDVDDDQATLAIDEFLEYGLTTPAAPSLRELMQNSSPLWTSLFQETRSFKEPAFEIPTLDNADHRLDLSDSALLLADVWGINAEPNVAAASAADAEEKVDSERHLNVWIGEDGFQHARNVRVGQPVTLNFQIGRPLIDNLISEIESNLSTLDVSESGIDLDWVCSSNSFELKPKSPGTHVVIDEIAGKPYTTARFSYHVPGSGDGPVVSLEIIPLVAGRGILDLLVICNQELYRRCTIEINVESNEQSRADFQPKIVDAQLTCAAGHLNLVTTHEWTTPPSELCIAVQGDRAYVRGELADGRQIDQWTAWTATSAVVAGYIKNTREAFERVRATHADYFESIDAADLDQRLASHRCASDWNNLENRTDKAHNDAWDSVSASGELREFAVEGHMLYEAFFPPHTQLRSWLDGLAPGCRINISWPSSSRDWIPTVPWGLMFALPIPLDGESIDAMGFWALRFRISYVAHDAQPGSKALGRADSARQAYLMFWGSNVQDKTGQESAWQRQKWVGWKQGTFLPTTAIGSPKSELLALLGGRLPEPLSVLYFYCQCAVGSGNNPVLRFGDTNSTGDVIRRTEFGSGPLSDRPLVFANACSTASSDPYFSNNLEHSFFQRGCRAFLGTESKVPIQFASRFAHVFFSFFYRGHDPLPIAAGEAVFQTRLFFWMQYRNIGGLFYTYINQYELFMADETELRKLRRSS